MVNRGELVLSRERMVAADRAMLRRTVDGVALPCHRAALAAARAV